MEIKRCPISNQPMDLIPHSRTAVQVSCPASHWTSSLFNSVDEAYDFRANLDVAAQVASASRESRNGLERLVGTLWMTGYMTSEALDKLITEATPAPAKPVAAKKATRTSKKKVQVPADAEAE